MRFRGAILGMLTILLFCSVAQGYDYRFSADVFLESKASNVAVNSASDIAAVVSKDGSSLTLLDLASTAITAEVPLSDTPTGLAIYQKENQVLVGSDKGELKIFDLVTGELKKTIEIGAAVYTVAVDENRQKGIVGLDGGLKEIDFSTGALSPIFEIPGRVVKMLPGQESWLLATRNEADDSLLLFDSTSGKVNLTIPLGGGDFQFRSGCGAGASHPYHKRSIGAVSL